jgi:hypothetical protein
MNQKGFPNIALVIVVIVIFVGVAAYFLFTQLAPANEMPSVQVPITSPTPISNNQQQPLVAQQASPRTDETQGWLTFTNKKYNYSFHYPQGSSVGSNQFATSEEEAFNVSLSSDKTHFHVEAQDPAMYSNSPATMKMMELPLKEFTQEIWNQNKKDMDSNIQNKEVGQISQTTVGGKAAYQFTLTGSYHDERGGYVLEKKYTYLFVENKGLNFIIWLPTDESTTGKILETFQFIN